MGGAIHNVVFAGFSAEALAARVRDAGARVIVTADEALRGGKRIPLKSTVDRALKECKDVSRVLVMRRTGAEVPMMAGRDEWMEEAMTKVSPKCSSTPQAALASQRGSGTALLVISCMLQSLTDMSLTSSLETCLVVLPTLVGSLGTAMWYTGRWPMEGPACFLSRPQRLVQA